MTDYQVSIKPKFVKPLHNKQITADIETVKEILKHLVKPEAMDAWFDKKVPLLNERTPMQMIRLGKTHLVLEVLVRVEESIHL